MMMLLLFLAALGALVRGLVFPNPGVVTRKGVPALYAARKWDENDSEVEAELERRLIDNLPSKRMRSAPSGKKARKDKVKSVPMKPEFSRILNVGSIPDKRPVLCKLLAKPAERQGLALRFDLPELSHFAANVTVQRQDPYTIRVEGTIEAHITTPSALLPPQEITGTFETLVLDSISSGAAKGAVSFSEATDYDEEIAPNGDMDLGEISAQYFSLELCS
jgi:hypothetical protein